MSMNYFFINYLILFLFTWEVLAKQSINNFKCVYFWSLQYINTCKHSYNMFFCYIMFETDYISVDFKCYTIILFMCFCTKVVFDRIEFIMFFKRVLLRYDQNISYSRI